MRRWRLGWLTGSIALRWMGTEKRPPSEVATASTEAAISKRIDPTAGPLRGAGGEVQVGSGAAQTRETGLWTTADTVDPTTATVQFAAIDELETDALESRTARDNAVVQVEDEEKWKNMLMFRCKFKKTPKHLTWAELGHEIECLDVTIDPDEHRPEERYAVQFSFTDKSRGVRDVVWSAVNDTSYAEGLLDLLAAVGACMSRPDVHRTIRFDDGRGSTREIAVRKRSKYTSEITLVMRPPVKYDLIDRQQERNEAEQEMEAMGASTWGFHPGLMDSEYRDEEDPPGSYHIALSAHALSYIMLRGMERLLERPLKDFYRPSQIARCAKVRTDENVGVTHAMLGWLGLDSPVYPHYTPLDAIQEHWLGADAPFTLVALINKMRELTYLTRKNPEFHSWLSVRRRDTALAIRNVSVKMLGAGASTLFVPATHNATVNRLLPKSQQRRIDAHISLNAALGMPDETRRIDELRAIAEATKGVEGGGGSMSLGQNAKGVEGDKK